MRADLTLIIDGNYILSKLVFTLHKHNLLYGGLHKALETTISNYRKLYPFKSVFMVSDSKEKSWRKEITGNYKSNRKKDSDIDWIFVYQAYDEFKSSLKGIHVLETPRAEGDDWISFLVNKENSIGVSTLTISNDYDIKQLVIYSLEPLFINMMSNEMYNKEKLFMPKNYQVFVNSLSKLSNDDIFNLNDNNEFLSFVNRLVDKYEVNEIDNIESLLIKIISGDTSDNISSVWSQVKNGKKRGIGDAGAKKVYSRYIEEFGEPSLTDPDIYENIADLICENKKLSKSEIPSIIVNIEQNIKLIDLDIKNIPDNIIDNMNDVYNNKIRNGRVS